MRRTQLKQPVLLGSRRSPLSGALFQPSLISEDSEGWDNLRSSFATPGNSNPTLMAEDTSVQHAAIPLSKEERLAQMAEGSAPGESTPASLSGIGWYAPITAQPFGDRMHPPQCGCEGCQQSGVTRAEAMGAMPVMPSWAIPVCVLGAALIYLGVKKGAFKKFF